MAREPKRKITVEQDLGAIEALKYNDAIGGIKMMVIQPVIKKAVGINEIVGAGKLVKITGTNYTLDLLGKAYSATSKYQKGDVVTNGGFVYLCNEDNVTGAFDATKWILKADKTIGPIPINAGETVSTGRWHNSVSVAGFLVDDESEIPYVRIRD